MNQLERSDLLTRSDGGLWPLINLSGDYVTFDVGEKKKQKVKIVGNSNNHISVEKMFAKY